MAGSVLLPVGETWSFEDPCLTTWEAKELLDWLRQVQDGHVQPSASRSGDSVTVRVHLSLEAWPPEESELFDSFVLIEMTPQALAAAFDSWAETVSAFPVR